MSYHYFIVIAAFLLGQLLITSMTVYNYQKEKNIDYMAAMHAYMKAEIGYFIVGFIAILCVCFILSDFIDLSVTKEDLMKVADKSWKENLQMYFKTSSLIIGSFIQYIAFKYKDKGKDAIDKAAAKV
jgi:predicted small secreted protein